MATTRERAASSPVAENGATTPETKTRVRRTGLQFDLIQLGPTRFVVVDTTKVSDDGGWLWISTHMSEATARLIARAQNAAAHENAAKPPAAST